MKSPWQQFWHPKYWPIFPLFVILRLIAYLPYKTQMQCGKFVGELIRQFASQARHTTEVNIRLCFPGLSPAQQAQLVQESFQSLGMSLFETAMAWFAKDEQLPPITIYGLEKWQHYHNEKMGVLFISAHLGSFELIGRLIKKKIPITAVYRPQKLKLLDAFTYFYRAQFMHKLIARDNLRELIRALKNGESVWYTPDVDAGRQNSVFVPFFNIPAATITTSSRLIAHNASKALGLFFYRRADLSGYDFFIEDTLGDFPSEDLAQDASQVNRMIENAIRKHPEQYLWQYKRFKTRPPGEARFYGHQNHQD